MGSTPVLKSSEVAVILRKLGFDVVRQRGSHLQFRDPRRRCTTVPFHRGRDLSPPAASSDRQGHWHDLGGVPQPPPLSTLPTMRFPGSGGPGPAPGRGCSSPAAP
ncbi:type II toxin-antitoxin system HicA family toxin [Synechococcus sp. BA-132 BA5]|uniref:type II toxin-antitoxin system HicA family toxin n=1 Tax=Synechococcus sp. BA-132 BA5 TaxID=3110252 RepID=UPI002B1E9CC4|nr:type II toxin-antitoxin system HicA family toxin [Synechococcus sp. BA-132 BA5]MEA5414547.1 type II toxin-antitoxin system HicA family toxin [Synechococcus sp. BA-132 BA5]